MASIVFNGHDLSDVTTSEVTMRSAQSLSIESAPIPGTPRRVITGIDFMPFTIEVRLMLALDGRKDDGELSLLRRRLREQLAVTDTLGATLSLPEEPGLEWRGVYAADVESWDALFEDGETRVTFESYDPVAWGEEVSVSDNAFTVGGSFPTWPTIELTAAAGASVEVTEATSGLFVLVEGDFAGGEKVDVNCDSQEVWLDGKGANAAVSLESDFFCLAPGACKLAVEGASEFTVKYTERWL